MRRQNLPRFHSPWPLPALILLPVVFAAAGCSHETPPTGTPAAAEGATAESAQLVSVGGGEALKLDPASLKLARVTTETVSDEAVHQTIQPTGQVNATDSNTVQVTARLPGRILEVLTSTGSMVQRGQLIAEVDSVDLTQAEASYQTALAHERLTYEQLQQQRRLAGYGALSEQPVEDARRAYAAAQAAVASDVAQIKLDRLTLANTHQLVDMGEITRKPVEDAQNA